MTDLPPPTQPPEPQPSLPQPPFAATPQLNDPFNDERQMTLIVYLLYLGSIVFAPTSIAGLVLAYVNQDAAPDWLKTHYTFQIRTFWIGLLYGGVSVVLCFVIIGIPLLLATFVWFVVRCALGIDRLLKREARPNPKSWFF
jgi:uncharacterized membrane protein